MFGNQLKRQTTRMSIQKVPTNQKESVFGKRKQSTAMTVKKKESPVKTISPTDQIVGLDPQQYTQKFFIRIQNTMLNPLVAGQLWRHTFSAQYPQQQFATISVRPQSFVLSCVNSSQLPQVVWLCSNCSSGFITQNNNFSSAIAGFVLSQVNTVQYQGVLCYNATYTCDDQATWDVPVGTVASFYVLYDNDEIPVVSLFQAVYLRIFMKNRQWN